MIGSRGGAQAEVQHSAVSLADPTLAYDAVAAGSAAAPLVTIAKPAARLGPGPGTGLLDASKYRRVAPALIARCGAVVVTRGERVRAGNVACGRRGAALEAQARVRAREHEGIAKQRCASSAPAAADLCCWLLNAAGVRARQRCCALCGLPPRRHAAFVRSMTAHIRDFRAFHKARQVALQRVGKVRVPPPRACEVAVADPAGRPRRSRCERGWSRQTRSARR